MLRLRNGRVSRGLDGRKLVPAVFVICCPATDLSILFRENDFSATDYIFQHHRVLK